MPGRKTHMVSINFIFFGQLIAYCNQANGQKTSSIEKRRGSMCYDIPVPRFGRVQATIITCTRNRNQISSVPKSGWVLCCCANISMCTKHRRGKMRASVYFFGVPFSSHATKIKAFSAITQSACQKPSLTNVIAYQD
ncbi:hypothetical protein BJV82DRAFT_29915 [Fennellomyces sp. T-0311]|nr:hypothetical protein BJV82DRAFT_29915 [Fennellomyces sp. T-0311]